MLISNLNFRVCTSAVIVKMNLNIKLVVAAIIWCVMAAAEPVV